MKPLNDLLIGHPTNLSPESKKKKKKKNKVPWQWGPLQQNAFDALKEKLSTPPVLAYADFKLPFLLHTDASVDGLGAVLYQVQDGIQRVIAYPVGDCGTVRGITLLTNLSFSVSNGQ